MAYSTGVPARDRLLQTAIQQVITSGRTPSQKLVSRELPEDFSLDEYELEGALGDILDKPPSEAAPETLKNIEAPRDPQPEPSPISTAKSTPEPVPMTALQANAAIIAAQTGLGEARIVLQRRRDATMKARADLANAITIWQTGLPPYTQESLIRDHLRSEQEKRRQRIMGGVPPQAKTHGIPPSISPPRIPKTTRPKARCARGFRTMAADAVRSRNLRSAVETMIPLAGQSTRHRANDEATAHDMARHRAHLD